LASLGHPYKFQRVLRLGSVTARHLVVGVSQTLRCWTEGATYVCLMLCAAFYAYAWLDGQWNVFICERFYILHRVIYLWHTEHWLWMFQWNARHKLHVKLRIWHCCSLYIGWSDVSYLWSQCNRHFVSQHVVLCSYMVKICRVIWIKLNQLV